MTEENRREFFRLNFDIFIEGEIIESERTIPINIENISAGGIGFLADDLFSINDRVKCSFSILDKSFLIDAIIIRKNATVKDLYEYGARFKINQDIASELFKQINFYEIRRKNRSRE